MMGRFKSVLIICITLSLINVGLLFIWSSQRYVVPIVMYHNVADTNESKANTVSPKNFEWQMAYFKKKGYRVLSFDEFIQLKHNRGKKPLPRKSVVITFDDAYEDNYTNAFRILRKFNYPAIIFAPSDLIGTEGYLTWDQVREMSQNGITFGSHTRNHAYLPDLQYEQQLEEIIGSKNVLEQQLNAPIEYFAYPIGGFSDSIKKMVKAAGYKSAVATNRGCDRFNKDLYELNRIRFGDKDDRKDYLWIKLSGFYNLFRKSKNPY